MLAEHKAQPIKIVIADDAQLARMKAGGCMAAAPATPAEFAKAEACGTSAATVSLAAVTKADSCCSTTQSASLAQFANAEACGTEKATASLAKAEACGSSAAPASLAKSASDSCCSSGATIESSAALAQAEVTAAPKG